MGSMNHTAARLLQILGKYKHAVLVVLIGVGLMLLPVGEDIQKTDHSASVENQQENTDLESRLEQILGQINGAGNVQVLLTERCGSEVLYQTNQQSETAEESSRQEADTVMIEDGNRGETGLIRRTDAPIYQGAIVVCDGGDNPQVRLAIVEAVQCVTGLGANQITVVKMK